MNIKQEIDFTRINNDTNGNPRYVCHFLNFITDKDRQGEYSITGNYNLALKRARTIGGKKFHNNQYGGGIVFQCYSIPALIESINNLIAEYK